MTAARPAGSSHPVLLTVEVEDYFHVGKFERLIPREQWYRFETRIESNTRKALDLLQASGVHATFFVLGWVADNLPDLVREIVARGHEVASMGYSHRTIEKRQMGPEEFRDDVVKAREALERASGRRVVGNRVPHYLGPKDLWALDVLAEVGYAYDSSLRPIFTRWARQPKRRMAHRHTAPGGQSLWEFPLSAADVAGFSLPIAGAGYFRHLPHALVKPAVARWRRRHDAPFLMYFRVWELDPGQPRIDAVSPIVKLRHYRNLDKMERVLRDYFATYEVRGIAAHLGLDTTLDAARPAAPPAPAPLVVHTAAPEAGAARTPVTVVIPCYNEEASLPYLANTLKSVEATLAEYDLRFLFVDDASRDQTAGMLERLVAGRPNYTLVRHERNRGVAAAILTGIQNARSEIVCSIDCDCTYDPHHLRGMIPLLAEGVDLVTASPYHPQGKVRNVPPWRLSLSKGASFLYRRVLRHKLWTYTSCFRVYRRSAVAEIKLKEGGFLGVAEMLGRLDLRGARIVEHPATLEVRIFGQSKMKTLRAVAGHLRLLLRLAVRRALGGETPAPGGGRLPSTQCL